MPKSNMSEPPEGIIVTIGEKMYRDKGYRKWLRDFLDAMKKSEVESDWFYWIRMVVRPTHEIQYVYLCIGGKIRYRAYFACSYGPGEKTFDNGKTMAGRAWILIAGPVVRAPFKIEKKGFQGFRYTEKLF